MTNLQLLDRATDVGCPGPAQRSNRARLASVLALALATGGCVIPRAGPSIAGFNRADANNSIELVDATLADAQAARKAADGFPTDWKQAPVTAYDLIGAHDVLNVSIYESDDLGVFPNGVSSVSQSGQANPGQPGATVHGLNSTAVAVDEFGMIQLPYLGRVPVAGLSLVDARKAILRKLGKVALSGDVTLAFAERHSHLVSIQGEVGKPATLPITPETGRLSGLLSAAGGIAGSDPTRPSPTNFEFVSVTVHRGAQSVTVRLADIYEHPAEDIAVRPGDVVIVRNVVDTVAVLGATGLQGRVRLTRRDFNVVDAVADAHGLNDDVAHPGGVYLMRLSEPGILDPAVPRVYHFDFRDPGQLVIASSFPVRNGDALLVSNASFAQVRKVLLVTAGSVGRAASTASIGNSTANVLP